MMFSDFSYKVHYGPMPIHERIGQFAFNLLYSLKPELANEIRGGPLDPFYEDSKVGIFLDYVEDHWKD